MLTTIFTQIGWTSAVMFAVLAALRPLLESWLKLRISEGVREGVERRLAEHQLDLDKDLERHRGELGRAAERLRAQLGRGSADYALWAERRHAATAKLFADLLQAEALITSMGDLVYSDLKTMPRPDVISLLQRCGATDFISSKILSLLDAASFAQAETEVDALVRGARAQRVSQQRNAAYEAYYGATLYLSDGVDMAARSVLDAFHAFIVEYYAPVKEEPNPFKLRTDLRFHMLELQNRSRADLRRGEREGNEASVAVGPRQQEDEARDA